MFVIALCLLFCFIYIKLKKHQNVLFEFFVRLSVISVFSNWLYAYQSCCVIGIDNISPSWLSDLPFFLPNVIADCTYFEKKYSILTNLRMISFDKLLPRPHLNEIMENSILCFPCFEQLKPRQNLHLKLLTI